MHKALLPLALSVLASTAVGQFTNKVWDNGPLVTDPGAGPGPSDLSVLQTVAPSPLNVFGFGAQANPGVQNVVGDDFVLGLPTTIGEIEVYSYQTGSTTGSTITGLYAAIWNTPPSNTGTPIWGGVNPTGSHYVNLLTNGKVSNTFTNIYRTTLPAATTRPIMAVRAKLLKSDGVTADPQTLPAGRYWLTWGLLGSLASGPWAPPVAIKDQPVTGDGLQAINFPTGNFAAVNGGVAPAVYGQGIPFVLWGSAPAVFPAKAVTYGTGKAGTNGVPTWFVGDSVAQPGLGREVRFRITNGLLGAAPFVFGGLSPANIPLPPLATVLVNPLPGVEFNMPAAGATNVSELYFLLPPIPTAVGTKVFWQGVILDSGAVAGVSHTNGLDWTFGQ